ncbi:MAG: 3-dehydroquinate synthase [Anaerolineae bacterium]|nr:3-dehydroquinate synthase [Anaerolineae bacterium]
MKNIILTGFMGTGKTTVGQEVARQLDRSFVDMDGEIELRAGKPISRIFAEDGEPAFREIEAILCAELSAQDELVIATGGGALLNPMNRKWLQRSGIVICLDAEPDEILRRVQDNETRPLLNVDAPQAEIARLLAERSEAYAVIPWHIETTGQSVDTIAAQVLTLAEMIVLPVQHLDGEYPIYIGYGLLEHLGGALQAAGVRKETAVAIVTNTVVGPLYVAQVESILQRAGYWPFVCIILDGEQYKTLDTVRTLYDQFLDHNFDRSGTVLALGGGVTGDIAGFAAATFMRGARFVQVPTSLLAMTDASVGGKTGVDLPQGKNLVGAFKQPELVLIDLDVLKTLPVAEFCSGMAELIKHGVIADAGLFEDLENYELRITNYESANQRVSEPLNYLTAILPPLILSRSIQVKVAIVQEDPFERGRRAVLNLGHTSAHGLERVSDFTLRHGEAVGIGMVVAARIAEVLGRAEPGLAGRIAAMLGAWGLPVTIPAFNVGEIWEAMTHDKKKYGKTLRWILPSAVGNVEIAADVPETLVRQILCEMGAKTNDEWRITNNESADRRSSESTDWRVTR